MTLSQGDLLKVFVEEALEHLSAIENDFLAMEKAGNVFDPDQVNRVFRAAHSIKGGAGFIGLRHIQDLAHKMETVLGRFRKEKQVPGIEIINRLLQATDVLKNLVANIEISDRIDISLALEALNIVGNDVRVSSIPATQPVAAGAAPHPSMQAVQEIFSEMAIPEQDVQQVRNDGKTIYVLRMDVGPDAMNGRTPEQVMDDIKAYTTFLASRSALAHDADFEEDDSGRHADCFVAFASVLSLEDVVLFLDIHRENLFPASSWSSEGDQALTGDTGTQTPPPPGIDESVPQSPNVLLSRPENDAEGMPTSIRVNIHLLDSLMNLAGELVLGRNQLLKAIAAQDIKKAEIVSKRVDIITSDLQKVIMLTRMQPVGSLFNRFPRMLRDLSRELGKETLLEVEGTEVELDRTLLEAMSDPLNHLIRNAVDHGIETADVRKRNGKPGTGKIRLKAYNEAGQVVIEVSDDGAGIDPEKVAAAAVSKGFVSEDQIRIMAQKDKMNLIFLPGFSTARTISDMSGRGVGMDVVKTNLDHLGGLIELNSAPGMGARFTIKLPLTLAIIPSQIVSTQGERFAIPQMNLEELLRIPAGSVKDRIERIGDAEVVRLREKLLPLVRLADILEISRTFINPKTGLRMTDRRCSLADRRSKKSKMFEEYLSPCSKTSPLEGAAAVKPAVHGLPGDGSAAGKFGREMSDRRLRASSAVNIALVSTGQMQYGLVVDAFHDAEEIVVKPLGRHLKSCRGYAGATIMGDGKVVLILDVNHLSEMAGLFSISGTRRAVEVAKTAEKSRDPHPGLLNVLVFKNAEDEQFALPLNQVIRIEKIKSRDIQSFGRFRVIRYRGGNLPVFSIDQVARVHPLADRDQLLVIVFMSAGRELGLLAIGPVDSMMTQAGIDGMTLKQSGILGSIILDGKITLLVDILDFTRSLHPEWFPGADSLADRSISDDLHFFQTTSETL